MNFFKRSDDPKAPLCIAERNCFGIGNGAIAWSYCLGLSFMTYYYTNYCGISAGTVGTIMLLSRVFDAITDIIMGIVIDRTRSKLGHCRPWILISIIPHMITTIIAFAVPTGWTNMSKYIYVFVTYNLLNSGTYTMYNVPLWAMNNYLTSNSVENGKNGVNMQIYGNLVGLIVGRGTLTWVKMLGGDAAAWTKLAAIFSVLGAVMMLICGLGVRERVYVAQSKTKDTTPLKVRLHALFGNKYAMLYFLANLLWGILWYGNNAAGVYYCQYVMGDANLFSTLSTYTTFATLAFTILVMPQLVKKWNGVKLMVVSKIICLVGYLIRAIFQSSLTALYASSVIAGLGLGMYYSCISLLLVGVCTYGTKKSGVNCVGITMTCNTVGNKSGIGIGSVVMGWIMQVLGFNAANAVQTASSIFSIKLVFLYMPVLGMLTGVIIFSLFKNIYKETEALDAQKA